MVQKLNVCILFGGQSSEHEVSRNSALSILKNIDKEKYNIVTIGITKKGKWLIYQGDIDKIPSGEWENGYVNRAIISPDADTKGMLRRDGEGNTASAKIDVVFPVLHGMYGEDGTVQGLLELANIPYVGPDVLSSALCMDKVYTNTIFNKANIPHAEYLVFNRYNYKKKLDLIISEIENKFTYPCFVKPSKAGSSVGMTKAHNREELIGGLDEAFKVDNKLLVEEFIEGREFECSVLGNYSPEASVVGEIIPSREYYDYDAKYNDDNSKIVIPADIPKEISEEIRKYAVLAFKELGCRGMSRVDFFVENKSNKVFINEINTIPGFTNISMYPKLWEASGISYTRLIDKLIELALEEK